MFRKSLVYTFPALLIKLKSNYSRPGTLFVVFGLLVALQNHPRSQDATLKAGAPLPLSPLEGAVYETLPSVVTLNVTNTTGTFATAIFNYQFEVYDVTDDSILVVSSLVSAGTTNTAYGFTGPFDYSRRYQWRARAELDGALGPWSSLVSFRTSDSPLPPAGSSGQLSFTDITVAAGINGPPSIPLGGHGAAFADATGNGRPDLYITTNWNDPVADQFFVNQGGGIFLESGATRGIADFDAGSHGGAWADLDNDGDYDLFNGATGTGLPNNIFRNDGGTFTDVTPAALLSRNEGTRGVVTFDMDKDGDLDLFAVSGWLGSGDPASERNELYRNDGDFSFTAISTGAAYTAPSGQGVTDTDFDGDGDIDLITGNRDGDLVILRNNGTGAFTLVDPDSVGITHQAYSGVTSADIDNDSDLDMLLVGLDSSGDTIGHLYRNIGSGTFAFARSFIDIDGYMGGFSDLDNDGDLDLVFAGDDVVYVNEGGGEFSPGPTVPVGGIDDPRAIGFADIDDDGDQDFAVGVKRSRNWLIRNDVGSRNWIKIKLFSPQGQAGAFGAKIFVYAAGSAGTLPLATRESRSNNGYLGQDDPVIHVGLGDITSVDITVNFVDGTTRVLTGASTNQTITIDGATGGFAPFFVEQQ